MRHQPATPPGQGTSPRLLDLVRQAIRVRHYSLRTEQAFVAWIRRFIVFHGKRHPRELGEREVTAFLTGRSGRSASRWCCPATRSLRCCPNCAARSG